MCRSKLTVLDFECTSGSLRHLTHGRLDHLRSFLAQTVHGYYIRHEFARKKRGGQNTPNHGNTNRPGGIAYAQA